MPLCFESPLLHGFWVSFKWAEYERSGIRLDSLPGGIGVTAFSREDAVNLLEESGFAPYLAEAKQITWTEITDLKEIDEKHVLPNAGCIYFRGIWYPPLNLGFGASGE